MQALIFSSITEMTNSRHVLEWVCKNGGTWHKLLPHLDGLVCKVGLLTPPPLQSPIDASGMRQISIRGPAPFFYQYVQPSSLHHQCREQLRTPQAQAWSGRSIDPPDQISSVFEKRYFKWETA